MTELPPSHEILVTDAPGPRDSALIEGLLDEFNVQQTGIQDRRPLAVLVKNPRTGKVVGGLTGRTSLGLLFIDIVYLPPELRGSGIGSEMLRLAEEEGRERGCSAGVVYTISFQAPGFYTRHGWRIFGEIPTTPGISRVYLTKQLH
jgi:GNAT superfamily N-acetyltransferase